MIWTEGSTTNNAINLRDVIRYDDLCTAETFAVINDSENTKSPTISFEESVVKVEAITDAEENELEGHEPHEAYGTKDGAEWNPEGEKNMTKTERTTCTSYWEERFEWRNSC